MKKVKDCKVDNCIPTPSSCVEWNCGDIEYLGICDGDSLCNVIVEIVTKLEEIAGDDLANFDIDSLTSICQLKAPLEVTLISILNLLKDNQLCLKDYIDTLNDKINELQTTGAVKVNLKCYADIDNLGNVLSITREQLDQLVIDQLCNHKGRIETAEGKIINLQSQINDINNNTTVEELDISTCVDPVVKPTSSQIISVAQAHCDLESATGTPANIASALSKVPVDWNTKYGLLPGWDLTTENWAEQYGNLLLFAINLEARVKYMEDNCCAVTCEDVKIGFTAMFSEDNDSIIIKFTSGAGTWIPTGFTDQGSTITFTDEDGNIEEFTTSAPDWIANNATLEYQITSLITTGDVNINIQSNISNGTLTCSKCSNKTIKRASCSFCVLTATDTVTIVYKVCPTVGV